MRARHFVATVSVATALLVIPTVAGAEVGWRTGDAICTETGEGIPDLSCLGHVLGGFLLGSVVGLAIGVTSAVLVVRRLRRRWREPVRFGH